MMTFRAFDDELRRRLLDLPGARPFVCDGSPLDCQAFIVGENPATALDFWAYWTRDGGFDMPRWRREYTASRLAAGKPPVSNTRRRIDEIVRAVAPLRCLETNVFAVATPTARQLGKDVRVSVLDFLVQAIQPAVILAHGKVAQESTRNYADRCTVLFAPRHLAYESIADAVDLGRRMRLVVERSAT
jgi:hypothetical protein